MIERAQAGNTGSPAVAPHDLAAIAAGWTAERRRNSVVVPLPPRATPPLPPLVLGPPGETTHGHGFERHDTPIGDGNGRPMLQPLNYPYRTCGRIFFNRDGHSFAAAAAMVAPSVLLTAGHCVHADGHWSTEMTFFPSYGARAASDRAFRHACGRLACRTDWIARGDGAHDYALVWMPGAPGNFIGWLGLLWNAPIAGRVWERVGYPSPPGQIENDAMEAAFYSHHANAAWGPICVEDGDGRQGGSGGPCITNWNETARSHVNGLQVSSNPGGSMSECGPYFTEDVNALFEWIIDPANH